MIKNQKFRELALSFEEAIELPHFENTSFRLGKKIFASLHERESKACLKLNPIDQNVFIAFDKSVVYAVLINGESKAGPSLN